MGEREDGSLQWYGEMSCLVHTSNTTYYLQLIEMVFQAV